MQPKTLLYLVSCLALAAGSDNRPNFASYDAKQTSDFDGAPIPTNEASAPIVSSDAANYFNQHSFSGSNSLSGDHDVRSSTGQQNSPPLHPQSSFNTKDECSNEHIVRYWGTVQLPPLDQSQPLQRSPKPVDSYSFYQPTPQENSMIKELRQHLAYSFSQFDFNRHLSDADLVRFIRARRENWEETLKMLSSKSPLIC